jgi:hypothetical protein
LINAQAILDSARGTLLDTASRTWSAADLLEYLNEGLRATVGVKADAYTREEYVTLEAGTLQTIPDNGTSLLRITENRNGRIVTQVDFDLLQESNRFWPRGTSESTVENYAADPRDPRRFVVSPPNDGRGQVRMLWATPPEEITTGATEMPVSDIYQPPLIDYVLSRAYAKNGARQDLTKSASYYQRWGQYLGLRSTSQIAVAPRVAAEPGTSPAGATK